MLTTRVQDSRWTRETEDGSGLQTTTFLARRSPERTAMKKIRKIKERRPKVGSHLNVQTAVTLITDADAQKPLNHKTATRHKQRPTS